MCGNKTVKWFNSCQPYAMEHIVRSVVAAKFFCHDYRGKSDRGKCGGCFQHRQTALWVIWAIVANVPRLCIIYSAWNGIPHNFGILYRCYIKPYVYIYWIPYKFRKSHKHIILYEKLICWFWYKRCSFCG